VDFCNRVDSKKVNKRVIEALIMAGAMDGFVDSPADLNDKRGVLLGGLAFAMQGAEQSLRNEEAGISDLFGDVISSNEKQISSLNDSISNKERLAGEKEILGLFLTGHPIDDYEKELSKFCSGRLAELKAGRKKQIVAGTIVNLRTTKGRGGSTMCFMILDDKSSRIEVAVYADRYEKYSRLLSKDQLVIVEGELSNNDYGEGLSVKADKILDINEARSLYGRGLFLDLSAGIIPEDFNEKLKVLLSPHRQSNQGSRVNIRYGLTEAEATLSLGENWKVNPSDDLLSSLKREFGEKRVKIDYI